MIEALAAEDGADAKDIVRSLVDAVVLHPDGDHQRVEVRGELAAILCLAEGAQNVKSARATGALAEQVKLVAGIGFEPMTFRL